MDPLVSVIMPAYNAEKTVGAAIESVLRQTYVNFELIVIDDRSKDDTYKIISEYGEKDSRVRVCQNEKNSGVSATRNYGASIAKGEYLALLDSDDMWREDKLTIQMKLMLENETCPFSFTGSSFVNADGEPFDYIFHVPETVNYKKLLKQNVVSCSSVIIRRELLLKYPMKYDKMHEDFATWLQILKNEGDARAVDEPLLCYRIATGTKSSNKVKSTLMTYRVYRYLGLNIFQIMYYLPIYTIRGIRKYSGIKSSKSK
ncbi:MAG: glycosyltransferase family 2 protein [Ruminococcaceae bacterium]|nr:glycosyltransferase family 2 protein [Oscillospiraceae bacterium]